jgi:hypothetical protein
MTYSGNKLINVNTLFPLVCIPILLIILPINENRWLFIPAILLITYFLYMREAYYFAIEDNFLIIKNIGLPFLKIKYKLSEIESIIIADKGFRSFSKAKLRVLKNGKKSGYYRGASLKFDDWRLLIKDLQKLNVKTIVEPYMLKSSPESTGK